MTTIRKEILLSVTDELASALRKARELLKDRCNASSWWNDNRMYELFTKIIDPVLAKYEAAKAQVEPPKRSVCRLGYGDACDPKDDQISCDCVALFGRPRENSQETEKGFPVVKVSGYVVNHMEWRDHALIVTVASRQEQPSDILPPGWLRKAADKASARAAEFSGLHQSSRQHAQEPSDLVKRLRTEKIRWSSQEPNPLCGEAADRIEALEAVLKARTETADELHAALCLRTKEIEELQDETR